MAEFCTDARGVCVRERETADAIKHWESRRET